MKFGKSLSNQIEETLPEWNDKFLSYKDLKKRLKSISFSTSAPPAKRARIASDQDHDHHNFSSLLEAELEKFNAFFVEKEEEYVIRQKEIQDRMLANHNHADDGNLLKEIVDFHGEMVLLENYSALNYTGLVKILKKYDKRTGALLRLPFIKKVLQQPFFSTELLYKLIKECEAILDRLLPAANTATAQPATTLPERDHVATTPPSFPDSIPDLDKIKYMEGVYMKSTVAALRVLKDIRKGSSTVSAFSLPPLQQQQHPYTTTATSTHVLEQTAK